MIQAIPEGNNLIPALAIAGAAEAIELYKKAFGAVEEYRMESPDGSGQIMHACIKIGNTCLFLADISPQMCGTPSVSSFYLYVNNVDATFEQAKKSGLTEKVPLTEMFWGDRMGNVVDKFGISWSLATHVRDVSESEMKKGAKEMFGKAA